MTHPQLKDLPDPYVEQERPVSNYHIVPNLKTKMLEIRGGNKTGMKLHEVPIDESKDFIQQMRVARQNFELMQLAAK
jgi:hypothetical protein